jgi:hypothetical protein
VLHNVNGRVYVLKCVLWYGSGKHNAVQIYIWMLPGIVRQARTNLGVPYMHVRWVYMLCAVLPCLVSWVFVECCSRETPGIQVGAGNISYHSQITKQTSKHSCHTAVLYGHRLHGHTLVVSLGACGLRSSTQVSLWESCYGELGQSRVTNGVWCGCDGDFKTCMVTAIFK